MKPSIVVVGSSNTDMVVKTAHLPAPGETVLGGRFFMNAGGKGANQAVAAQRLGGAVTFVAKVGTDIFGEQAIQLFRQEGIDTSCILSDANHPSGVALITIDDNGENCIAVASGANAALLPDDLEPAIQKMQTADAVLMQLETPVETVLHVASLAAQIGKKVILNPAPACVLPDGLFKNISIITPNEGEAEVLTGIKITDVESLKQAAAVLHQKGVAIVIITLGAQGAFISDGTMQEQVAAPQVHAVDTTAAGDVFNGALAVALSEGMHLRDAVQFGCNAAALSVTRLGAQAAAPYRHEVH
jgi:ribokinase